MSCKSNDSYLEKWQNLIQSFYSFAPRLAAASCCCQLLGSWFVTSNSCEWRLLWGSAEADTIHGPLTEVTLVTPPPSGGWRINRRKIFLMDDWLLYHSMSVRSNRLHPALPAQKPDSALVNNIKMKRIKCSGWIIILIEEQNMTDFL